MKKRFADSFLAVTFFLTSSVSAFQLETPQQSQDLFSRLEAGQLTKSNAPPALVFLQQGEYFDAIAALDEKTEAQFPWLREYLERLTAVSTSLILFESPHFKLFVPAHQQFLASYALPALEQTAAHYEKMFGYRPRGKVRVEIYSTKEEFSAASTLSEEILERSGAIGICKFHRLMILTPQALPLGYRWMDALAHEYTHFMINELTSSRAELWLHEGTAKYFDTSYRSDPPDFLTPHQKTALKEAQEKGTLVPFRKMSPSLVYLKDQDEVSLAFAQVSHAISWLLKDKGVKRYGTFLKSLTKSDFPSAFKSNFGWSPEQFEQEWLKALKAENWEKTKGTIDDRVSFSPPQENEFVGADVRGRMALGDKMRLRGHDQAALIEYERALREEPDNALVLLKAARMNLKLGQKDEAVVKLRRAVEKNPNYGTPHIELAKLVEAGERVGLLETANALNPFNPEIHLLWAEALAKLGRSAAAAKEKEIYESLKVIQ